jgi:endonuclease G
MAFRSTRAGSKGSFLLLFILIAVVLLVLYFYQVNRHDVPPHAAARPRSGQSAEPGLSGLELPAPRPGEDALRHSGYSLGFDRWAHQAAWVAYLLTASEVNASHVSRSNNFRPDPSIDASADNSDYEGSGYDRGHLAPAEDQGYSAQTMSESFYYSNMSPQVPAFNRGVWKRLEELVRFWAKSYDSIYITTGPVLEAGLPAIGPHQVAVPRQYYKAVLVYGKSGVRAIAFLLRNEASAETLKAFAVPVDEVERVTGLDLFAQLPDDVENEIEKEVRMDEWKWRRR